MVNFQKINVFLFSKGVFLENVENLENIPIMFSKIGISVVHLDVRVVENMIVLEVSKMNNLKKKVDLIWLLKNTLISIVVDN